MCFYYFSTFAILLCVMCKNNMCESHRPIIKLDKCFYSQLYLIELLRLINLESFFTNEYFYSLITSLKFNKYTARKFMANISDRTNERYEPFITFSKHSCDR